MDLSLIALSVVASIAPPIPVAHIAVGTAPTPINPLYMGCHSDSGFVHQVRGFSSQMIFGESFEAPQANVTAGKSADAWSFGVDSGVKAGWVCLEVSGSVTRKA